jgi:predicted dehydrogenase
MIVTERPLEAGGRIRPVDVPDECWALLEFATGIGSVKLSWNANRDQQIELEGDRGKLLYQSPSLLQWLEGKGEFSPLARIELAPGSARTTDLPLQTREFATPEQALARMFRDIVAYLQGGEKPDCVATFRDGAEVMKVIDAIEQSNETGNWVEISQTTA